MKGLFVVVLCLAMCVAAGFSQAEQTEDAQWNNSMIDSIGIFEHDHSYVDNDTIYEAPPVYEDKHHDNTFGLGADVVVWEGKKFVEEVRTDYRYDIRNDNHSIFLVGKMNVFKWWQNR